MTDNVQVTHGSPLLGKRSTQNHSDGLLGKSVPIVGMCKGSFRSLDSDARSLLGRLIPSISRGEH